MDESMNNLVIRSFRCWSTNMLETWLPHKVLGCGTFMTSRDYNTYQPAANVGLSFLNPQTSFAIWDNSVTS